jgi:hypothetical protein
MGSKVGTVEAVDEDIGENGMIDYLITCKLLSAPGLEMAMKCVDALASVNFSRNANTEDDIQNVF